MILALLVLITFFVFINLYPKFYTRKKYSYPYPYANIKAFDQLKQDSSDDAFEGEDLNAPASNLLDDQTDYCEVIHIGIVCSGHSAVLQLHTFLKSLFFYRVNPIYFHIITNKESEKILDTLFRTWNVPQVKYSFYDLSELAYEVRWVPNVHYSGIHGLLKLVFPKIIPQSVTKKILVLDIDLTVISDIYELWSLFKEFDKKQAIGIVENESDYYLKKNVWPAIGRGFNSGVMLLNVEKLMKVDWPRLWTNITKRETLMYSSTRLADQDIINAVLKRHPYLLFEVPCVWNVQLSDHTLSYNCYKGRKVKIVHWNSPKKFNIINKDGDYFRSLAIGFQEYNGNLLRKQLQLCDDSATTPTIEFEEPCGEFHKLSSSLWRTILFFRDFKYESREYDITFVAQLSYDRLQTIEEVVKNWAGPISLTLYVSDADLIKTISFISHSEILNERTNVGYHAVFTEGEYYPINTLRNIGLRNAQTPYVFLADIDFVPSKQLYEHLIKHISRMGNLKKKALVVPAFEIQKYGGSMLRNKSELLKELQEGFVIPFLSNIWASGHEPTDYERWKTAEAPYKVQWKPDYEPYIVVSKGVVGYNEKFVGFGWNKVSHIMELEAQGYEFLVLPDVFIVHKPHVPSYDIARFRTSIVYRMCLQMLKEEFIQRLNKEYDRSFENTNSTMSFTSIVLRRRKRNFQDSDRVTTIETNTDYPTDV